MVERVVAGLSDPIIQARRLLAAAESARDRNRLALYRPYPKQSEFHAAGSLYRERLLMAANRVGKTLAASMETAIHLTGRYPEGWSGKRFYRPVAGMAASKTGKLTRDGVQVHLLGWPKFVKGTGAVPLLDIISTAPASGVPDFYDFIRVKHYDVTGTYDGDSILYLRSYDQGRERVQAMTLDLVWMDEEPDDYDFYMEALTRTNIGLGIAYLTFTPLLGQSEVVRRFTKESIPGTYVVNMGLVDALHFPEEERKAIIDSYPEHERNARVYGLPSLGSGAVFPISEREFVVEPFDLPAWWPRIAGIDFGYWDHATAATWQAWDRESDCVYIYKDYAEKQRLVPVHASAMRAPGAWIPWAWPQDGLQIRDGLHGEQPMVQYRNEGLSMLHEHAQFEPSYAAGERIQSRVSLEAGIQDMITRLKTDRLKVFSSCLKWLEEYRGYHREKGLIIKEHDDVISASRYAIMMLRYAKTEKDTRQNSYMPEPESRY